MKILIIGNGYIGKRCAQEWPDAVVSDTRITTVQDVYTLLEQHQPDAVLNAAGVVGKPNVDWCETHQMETINGNTILPLTIAEACQNKGIYLLHIGTGCIFYGASPDPKGWLEEDFANPLSVYSKSKYAADMLLATMPNIGIARIRLPVDDFPSDSNMITKLAKFKTVLDIENSITVVSDMVRVFRLLLEKKAEGIFHTTQKGSIKYRRWVELYNDYIEPLPEKEWVTEDELLARGSVAKHRATNILQSKNLEKYDIHMRETEEILIETMKRYKEYK